MSDQSGRPPQSGTRAALGRALQDQLRTTPLRKITVRQLTEAAGVTRQAFYYHFADINDLTVWVFTEEIARRILSHAGYEDWSDGFLSLLLWLQARPNQVFAVVDCLSHEELERFFHHQFTVLMRAIVSELQGDLELREEDRDFVIDHFALAVLGHLLHWLVAGMTADPYVLVEKMETVLHGSVRTALERFAVPRP